ncbi:MAG TPA: O-antigen ligase family protein [Terriglobales bacterium]|nr:O-antigen ligase family protein [Terriglobales bacterium]
MAKLATLCFIVGIAVLFRFVREKNAGVSKAIWIPVIYLLIISSRPLSAWLGIPQPEMEGGVYSSPFDATFFFVLLVLAVFVLLSRQRKVMSVLRGNGPLLLFYSYAAISMAWSDLPYVTLKHWTKGIEDVLMVLIVVSEDAPVLAMRRIFIRAGFLLIPLSVLVGVYYPIFGRRYTKSGLPEFTGVSVQKNQLGQTCLIFGLGLLWCLFEAYRDRDRTNAALRRRLRLLSFGTTIGIVAWLLNRCHSLTSTVCLILGAGLIALAGRSSKGSKPARVHLLVAAALSIALIPLFVAPTLVETVGRDTTFSGRTEIWSLLVNIVKHPLLGAGYETFLVGPRLTELVHVFGYDFQEAHNGYLEIYLNLGWIGVSLFAFVVIDGYRKIVAGLPSNPFAGSLRLALLVAVLIEGLSEAPFRMMTCTWFALLWAIIGASKQAISLNRSKRSLLHRQGKREITPIHDRYANESETRIPV